MTFDSLAALMQRELGWRLFTVMRHGGAFNQRVWSSDPVAYPPGGRKPVRDTAWTRVLLRQGRPFLCRDAADIRAHFADAAAIIALGCESCLNLPVLRGGRVVGTVNLLDVAHRYDAVDLDAAVALLGDLPELP